MEVRSTEIEKFDSEHPKYLNADGTHRLNDKWVLWYHPLNCNDWETISDITDPCKTGYKIICSIDTVERFWTVFNNLPCIYNGFWFLMKEGIPPIWESPVNVEGGAFKFCLNKRDSDNTWLDLALYLISGDFCKEQRNNELVSGMTLSPKYSNVENVVISVWNLDSSHVDVNVYPSNIPGINFSRARYEPHRQRKDFGNTKPTGRNIKAKMAMHEEKRRHRYHDKKRNLLNARRV